MYIKLYTLQKKIKIACDSKGHQKSLKVILCFFAHLYSFRMFNLQYLPVIKTCLNHAFAYVVMDNCCPCLLLKPSTSFKKKVLDD